MKARMRNLHFSFYHDYHFDITLGLTVVALFL